MCIHVYMYEHMVAPTALRLLEILDRCPGDRPLERASLAALLLSLLLLLLLLLYHIYIYIYISLSVYIYIYIYIHVHIY